MKNMTLMKLEQDFYADFRWWHYESLTGEAMIFLCTGGCWRTIKILDPMWLVNLSEKDIELLYYNKNYYQVPDIIQVMQYQNLIRVCYAYEVNSGKMWNTKWRELKRKEFTKDVRN
ncbi:hypothetical protein Hanom_Chr13g01190991 [Helianthus anomalus]